MKSLGTTNSTAVQGGLYESPIATLHREWRAGQAPELVSFVPRFPDIPTSELAALIRTDFEFRWSRHDRRKPEDYLNAFAAVKADTELAVDIIYDEYLAREQSGERPEVAEYQQRFPEYSQILTEQIRLHHALDSIDGDRQVDDADFAEVDSAIDLPAEQHKIETSYEILEQIGTGGMGVVYKARQPALNRFVALKMVRAIDADNLAMLARFHSEARVVAALRHPNIVQVYEYGQHDGLPYIAMELIEGGSLADRLNGVPWPSRTAAQLIVKLAAGIDFAHQRHIVHRDLKPANVLVVTEGDDIEVKITDFGLAKFHLDESSSSTKSFCFLGTPSYMAPEQASGASRMIGPSADIYSLGAILFELLAGAPPIYGETPMETLRLLLTQDPVSVKSVAPQVPNDLATICDKCLQRDPARRYASAAELGADLTRFLEGKPIYARQVSQAERVWRWCRRNPYLAGALSTVGLLLLGIAVVSLWYSTQLNRAVAKTQHVEQAGRAANQSAKQHLWDLHLKDASVRNASHNVGQRFAALQSIDKAIAKLDTVGRTSERELQLRNAVLASIALPDIHEVRSLGKLPAKANAYDLSVAADRYLIATADGTLSGYRLSDSQPLWTIKTSQQQPTPQLSPDCRLVAAIAQDGVKIWSLDRGEPQLEWEVAQAQFFRFLSDHEHAVYSLPGHGMRLVRARDGSAVRTVGAGEANSSFAYHSGTDRLAVCGPTTVQVIALRNGEIEAEFPASTFEHKVLAWHPSGEYLAVWGNHNGITLWNVKSRAEALVLPHLGIPAQLGFNEDGSHMVSQSLWDKRLCVWDAGTGRRLLEVRGFVSEATSAGPDRRLLFLTKHDGEVSLMELTAGTCRALASSFHVPLAHWSKISLSPDSRLAAFSSLRGLELWDLRTTQRLLVRELGGCSAEFDREGGLFVASDTGVYHFTRHISPPSRQESGLTKNEPRTVVRFGDAKRLTGPIVPWTLGVSSSGQTLIYGDDQGWALQQVGADTKTVRLQTELDPRLSAVSNDDRFAAIANWDNGGARVWNAQTGERIHDLTFGAYGILQFSPDGRFLAATPDGVTLWNTKDWKRARNLQAAGTTPTGLSIAFSPDSRVLAVGQVDGMLMLFDPRTGNEWARLPLWDSGASTIAFSPDQRWLVASPINEGSPPQMWDLTAIRRELTHRGLALPSDVLRPIPMPHSLEQPIEVLLEDTEILDGTLTPKS